MRALRTTLAAACFAGLAPAASSAADITAEQLLRFPTAIKGVEFETPTDPAAIAACKVENLTDAKGGPMGWALRDGQGKLLRRFVSLRASVKLDQWSYYQDGFEVYREVDLTDDQHPDEVRWLNAAGTRVAKIVPVAAKDHKAKVASWSRLSAEEASKVFVQALVAGDSDLLETVMATPADLEALGIPKSEVARAAAAAQNRVAAVKALRGGLVGWNQDTAWIGLNATLPHLIPSDAGVKEDVILLENATIFAGAPNGAGAGSAAFLQVGEAIKIGETWKFVDLPRVVDPKGGVVAAVDGGIRAAVFRSEAGPAAGAENPQVAEAMAALAAYDRTNEAKLAGEAKDLAQFHVGRVAPLNKIVKAAEAANDAKAQLDHQKLIVDSLAAAYSTGTYPTATKYLEDFASKGGKLASYAAFKQIEAEFTLQNQDAAQGNALAVQDAWLGKLKAFVEKYGQSDEAPQALLFLASTNEMNTRESEAKKYYAQLAETAPATEWGKKAAGALRRLDLDGKPLDLKATDLRGKTVDASAYRGKTLLVTFWATWANPAKRDLPDLAKLHAKYNARGFEVLAINLDNDKAELDAFLKASPLPWPEVFEPGGMEGRLATEFGVISLPTMFLVGPDGKVVNRNLRTASEVEILLDKTYAKAEGVALKPK